ncbi:homeobox domain protein [Ancylostoma caninum]|uniref:Homeobox domain protein n=1 Tax=Ancylostoma caninum TaxID=29170 RepID=A0A368GGB2_ANCCA|nr:homeobox domain protein [Ancylostoma caninum]
MDVHDGTRSSGASHDDGVKQKSSREPAKDPRKRQRTTFTQSQLRILEDAFARQQYLVGSERVRLAALLNIGVAQVSSDCFGSDPELKVKVWFQNRRIRWRREQREVLMRDTPPQSTTMTSSDGVTSSIEPLTSSASAVTTSDRNI